ncbi:MAG TPA: hypothetical protein VNN55_01710 [bacterium]|nr:hypothetical protein [bacterium]
MSLSRCFYVALVVLLCSGPALAQSSTPSPSNASALESEIASLEKQRRTGIYMAAGGTALSFLSLALVPSSDIDYNTGKVSEDSWVPFYLVLGTGSVLSIVGVYKWFNASQDLGPLKAKKYGLEFTPTFDLPHRSAGMMLSMRF